MGLLRLLLIAIFTVIVTYTGMVISNHGINLLPIFFGDMAKLGWPGQFNLDFMCMLTISGLWVAWRHDFGVAGIALGLVAVFGGALFLSIYLLIESYRCGGNVRNLLLGAHRVDVT